MIESHTLHNFLQFTRDGIDELPSNVAIESPVSLTVNGQVWVTFHCSPTDLESLAVGFLFNEGFIKNIDEVENVHVCNQKDNVDVWLNHPVEKPTSWQRTSGCHGGSSAVDLSQYKLDQVVNDNKLAPDQIFGLMSQFMNDQPPHAEYGGVHTSALAEGPAQLFQITDIGRHNTLDKIAGRIILEKIELAVPVIVTSGRISSDMVQKSVRMQIPFLISMRSTSLVSIQLAEQNGITLIAGARRGRFNLYSHAERIDTNQLNDS